MKDPKPLLRSHPTGPVANLLRAARADVPSAKGRRRTLAAIGTAAGLAAATGVTEAAAAVSVGVSAGTTALVKSVVLAAVAMTAAGGAAYVGTRATVAVVSHVAVSANTISANAAAPNAPPQNVTFGASSARAVSVTPVLPSAVAEPVAPSAPVASFASAPSAMDKPRTLATPNPAPRKADDVAAPSELAAELAAVDRARRALQAYDAREALRQLDAYESRFSPPRFEQEATLLRVEALIAVGDADHARAIGERFLVREPDSTYSQRIRSLLGARVTPAPRP